MLEFTVAELARILSLSDKGIRRWINSKKVRCTTSIRNNREVTVILLSKEQLRELVDKYNSHYDMGMYFNDSEHNSECSVSISKDSNCDSFEQKEEIYDVQFSTVDTERIEPEESFGSDGMEDNTEHVESVRSDLKFDEFLQGFQVIIKQNQELTDEIRQLVPYKEQVKFIETSEKKTKEEYFKLRAENETLKEQNVRNDEKYKYLEAEQKTLKQQIEELKNQNKKLEDQNKDYLDKLLKKNSIFSWFAK